MRACAQYRNQGGVDALEIVCVQIENWNFEIALDRPRIAWEGLSHPRHKDHGFST